MFIVNSFWFVIGSVMAWCKLMKTGQTTSYRTGDDGDLEKGRDVDFTTLDANNPFGNTNRFTDELGGSTYTNNIVIDWSTYDGSTVLGYYRVATGSSTWNNAVDNSLTTSVSTFTSGWRLTNIKELINILQFEGSNLQYNYSPFNITATLLWSSTTNMSNTANAYYVQNNNIGSGGKTASQSYIPCRTFTVTGTTLS